ncbi:MAG: hypothetical protein QM736_05780 [Vicinamibacterales bacterium]
MVAAARQLQFVTVGRDAMNLYATHLRFDGLLVGTALAYLHHFRPQWLGFARRHPIVTIVAGALLALPWMVATPDLNQWTVGLGLTLMYVGFALVVIGAVHFESSPWGTRVFATGPAVGLAAVGFYSYGIYLWHIDLVQTPMKKIAAVLAGFALPETVVWIACTLGYVAGAIAAGMIMTRLIELPALAWRQRHFGEPSLPAQAEPATAASAPLATVVVR